MSAAARRGRRADRGTSRRQRTAAWGIFEVLRAWGVDRVFVCPGSTEAAFLDASLAFPDIELVMGTHESAVLAAADGYARVTGRPAVAYLHANVGLVNALGSLYAAQLAWSPVVVLNGLKARGVQASGGFTTSPYMRDYVRQHVKRAWASLEPAAVAQEVDRAFALAASPPEGPVWLGLAQDLLEGEAEAPVRAGPGAYPPRSAPDPGAVTAAAALLREARTPVLVAGGEVARRGAADATGKLAEVLEAPLLAEDRRSLEWSSVDTGHPNYAGMYHPANRAVAAADVVCLVGVDRFVAFEAGAAPPVPVTAKVIHSSASPDAIVTLGRADVGVAGDAALVVEALLAGVGAPADEALARERRRHLHDAVREGPGAYAYASERVDGAMSVAEVVGVLAETLPAHATVISDATTSHTAVLQGLPRRPGSFFTSASGSLGWGLGAALGIQLGQPDRRAVGVLGDGVFQFGIQALWTAEHYGIPVVFVVVNNESYAAVGAAQRRHGSDLAPEALPCKDLSGPRLATVASGFGIAAWRASSVPALREALAAALATDGPAVVEAMTNRSDLGPSASLGTI